MKVEHSQLLKSRLRTRLSARKQSFPRGDILQNDVVFLCFTYVFSRRFHNYFLACFETNCPELSSTQSSPRWASSCSSCLGRVLINAQMSGLGAKLNSRPEHYWF